jgi:diguanylate cyclase (GGDEF)-like protein
VTRWSGFQTYLRSLSTKGTLVLSVIVSLAVLAMAELGHFELNRETERHIAVRLDRAARAAAAMIASGPSTVLTVTRHGDGAPRAYQIRSGSAAEVLVPSARFDAMVEDIARVNQGFVNLFRFDAADKTFERIATTMRGPQGEYVRTVRFGASHPAYAVLLGTGAFVGEVPQTAGWRLASIVPILGETGEVAGALAVDVGWSTDLWRAATDLGHRIAVASVLLLITVACFGSFLMFRAMYPLRVIADYARRLAAHEPVGPMPYRDRHDEVGHLAICMDEIAGMRARLERLAFFDSLTGFANRARLEHRLDEMMREIHKDGGEAGLVLLGIDNFRAINDVFGLAAGDGVLVETARRLAALLPARGLLARHGADEFALLLPSATAADLSDLAERAAACLRQPFAIGRATVHLDASAGIIRLPVDAADTATALRNAHITLNRAKQAGRGRIETFAARFDREVLRRAELERDLREAIVAGELLLHFQPQVRVADLGLHGVEAQVRWDHPRLGMVPPAEFIPVAEDAGLIGELGAFVLDEACRTGRQWLDAGFDFGRISVNVSPLQFWQPNFAGSVAEALARHDLPAARLCLEVTETLFLDPNAAELREMLTALNRIGVHLSLDDFGAGCSSLSSLSDLPFTQIKIDRSFVRGIDTDLRHRNLFIGIVALGHGLGMQVVAEGAETAGEVATIADSGANAVQGFYFARPVPALCVPLEAERIARLTPPAPVSRLRIV